MEIKDWENNCFVSNRNTAGYNFDNWYAAPRIVFMQCANMAVCQHQIFNSRIRSWWRHQMETYRRYWPFVREIHRQPASDAEFWCFLGSPPEQPVKLITETLVIWNANAPIMTSLYWWWQVSIVKDSLYLSVYLVPLSMRQAKATWAVC